jgi:LmbE family N-acetylglucosaminyl deacetylase
MPNGILLIFDHPDDDIFIAAGTTARYVAEGVRVSLVCATLGQAGKMGDPPITTREQLPAVRERELHDACDILGIDRVELLGYEDKHLAEAPPDRIREQLVRAIRRERPTVVITFDPNGANVHPDHIAISRFASDAVTAAADPRWFPDAGAAHRVPRMVWTTPAAVSWRAQAPAQLAEHPGVDFLIDISAWRERKVAALHAHRSQHLSVNRIWFEPRDSERLLSVEMFRLAWGGELVKRPVGDLFAGLDANDVSGWRSSAP